MSDKTSYVTINAVGVLRFGTFLLVVLSLAYMFSSCASFTHISHRSGPVPKLLVLGLDGIPFSTFKKMQDGGHFRNFNAVAPMVASFPSISDPNWALLYQTGPEPNFTKAFFDPTIKTATGLGAENGGVLDHVAKEPVYEKIMDFKVDGIWEHLSTFIWTDTTSRYWLESLEKQFFDFRGRDTFYALIINTDLVSHTEGEMSLMRYLAQIEETLYKIQARYKETYGENLDVILISDHGNAFFQPKDVPFEKALENLGWSFPSTLSGPKDVGYYVPELLSFGAFYCQPGSSRQLARDFSKVPQVQSAMYAINSNDIRVFAENGNDEVQVIYDEAKETIDYKILKGRDPFGQIGYFKNGPLNKDAYFHRTLRETYPYAFVRIWEGFNKNSKIKPQVLVNAELGSVFGNTTLRLMVKMRGFESSHGSLHRDETLGIFASTTGDQATVPIRPQDFHNYTDVSRLLKKSEANGGVSIKNTADLTDTGRLHREFLAK